MQNAQFGPWHRGHDADADHLAIAFYRGGKLIRSYSTLEIAGGEEAADGGTSRYKNVFATVSHYTVFQSGPEMIKVTTVDGAVYSETWSIQATTTDGRVLTFDMASGEVRQGSPPPAVSPVALAAPNGVSTPETQALDR